MEDRDDREPEKPPPTFEQQIADAVLQRAVDEHMPIAGDMDGMVRLMRHQLTQLGCPRLTCRMRRRIGAAGIESLTRLGPRLARLPRSVRLWEVRLVLITLRFTIWAFCLKFAARVVHLFRCHSEEEE